MEASTIPDPNDSKPDLKLVLDSEQLNATDERAFLESPEIVSLADALIADGQVETTKLIKVIEELELEPEQAIQLLDYLEEVGIKIITIDTNDSDSTLPKSVTPQPETDSLSTDPMHAYMSKAGKHDLLTKHEEVRLAKLKDIYLPYRITKEELDGLQPGQTEDTLFWEKIKDLPPAKRQLVVEGKKAFDKFVESNLKLVASVSRRYNFGLLPMIDLIQEGNLGLIRAVEKFDWTKGFKFSTYATWWIRQAVTRGQADKGRIIRLPIHINDRVNSLNRTTKRLIQERERDPTPEELAEETGIPLEEVVNILRASKPPASLEAPTGEDDEGKLGDFVSDKTLPTTEEAAEESIRLSQLRDAFADLSERERFVLTYRFGLDLIQTYHPDDEIRAYSLTEIGQRLNVTRQRVQQVERKALKNLAFIIDRSDIDHSDEEPSEELYAYTDGEKTVCLTATNTEIIKMLAEGKSRAEISIKLRLSEGTVKGRKAAFRKLFGATTDKELTDAWRTYEPVAKSQVNSQDT